MRRTASWSLLALFLFLSLPFTVNAATTVLLTPSELAQAKANIAKEPLKSYIDRLSANDGGDAAHILYLLTSERKYAEKARVNIRENLEYLRAKMPYMVNIWILRSPFNTVSALLSYDMTRESGLYSPEEAKEIHETLSWVIDHYLNKGKDHIGKGFLYQTDYFPEDMEDWTFANMNVHRLLAVGLYGLVFPDDPRAKEITAYASNYFERVLSLGSRPGGAWAENPRYMGGVLQELYLLAAGLKNAGVHDYFSDDRLRSMLGFFAESIPSPGITDSRRPTMLCADDATWWENPTAVLGWAAARYAAAEPKTASEWIWCWKTLGSVMTPESLLFINPDIAPVQPSYGSYLPGLGYVIMRERFAQPDETFFFATFGPEFGTSNRTMHHQPNHGDFSLIWRGFPLTLTTGCSSYVWSRRMRDQTDFSHNVVTFEGAGKTLAIPDREYSGPATEVNTGVDESLVRDLYGDGLANHAATPTFEYASGNIYNWETGLRAPFNMRHFLFLKPDVFVVWDQVRSAGPLQWNFQIPAESVAQNGNGLLITNKDGVKLSVDFIQDEPLDWTLDWPVESIRADWPLVLKLNYGKGMFIFNALDIARQALDNNHPGALRILENALSHPARPKRIGLIETDGQTAKVLDRLGMKYQLLDYAALGGDLSRFDRIVVGQFAVLVRDRDMVDYREKLWKYVENGGVCYWAYQYAWGWKPGDSSGPGYFPKELMVGEGTSILWGEGVELDRPVTMHADLLWNKPNRITARDWDGWAVGQPDTFKVMPIYPIKPNTDRARNIPVYYSDEWQVLASALKTYNITPPPTRTRFGPYRWIKVHHKASDDFLAILRPWKEGVNGDRSPAEIIRGSERETFITQGADTWRLLIGNRQELRCNLALIRYDASQVTTNGGKSLDTARLRTTEPKEILLADALGGTIGAQVFLFEHPMTLHYDAASSTGGIATLEGGKVTVPWGVEQIALDGALRKTERNGTNSTFALPPGEYVFARSGGTLALIRTCHLAQVEVVDSDGKPIRWVHVLRDLPGAGRTIFQGATDEHGRLTLRWTEDGDQKVTLSLEKKTMRGVVRAGAQSITVNF